LREQLEGDEGNEGKEGELQEHEERRLREQVQLYVDQRVSDPNALLILGGPPSFTRVHASFKLLREIACAIGGGQGKGNDRDAAADSEELQKLRELLDHRDNEISILVNMVKRGKTVPSTNFEGGGADSARSNRSSISSMSSMSTGRNSSSTSSNNNSSNNNTGGRTPSQTPTRQRSGASGASGASSGGGSTHQRVDATTLADKRKSFDVFRRTYTHNSSIEENKHLLRSRYDSAKEMGLRVNEARAAINKLKARIEQLRVERANVGEMGDGEGKTSGSSTIDEYDALEGEMQKEVSKHKVSYKQNFSELRSLKGDVERIQGQLKKQRVRMQKEFDLWHETMTRNLEDGGSNSGSNGGGNSGGNGNGGGYGGGGKVQEMLTHPGSFPATSASSKQQELLTGDKDVDRDILQFFAAKQALLKR